MKIIPLIFGLCFYVTIICSAQSNVNSVNKTVETNELYTITGKITDKATGNALPYVNIYLSSLNKGAVSDTNGIYQLNQIRQGAYEIKFSFIGYKEITEYIQLRSQVELNETMEVSFNELRPVVVTPGIYNISAAEPTMSKLSSKEILQAPNFAKDINRTLRVIPGFANNDISSKPRIRGGQSDETATFIDNFEIYEPYHFEELDGLASIFNTDYAKEIIISTGGYSSKYTDKMSGIIEVNTPDYVTKNQVSASIDFLSASVNGKAKLNERTSILGGIRRGYLDLIMNSSDMKSDISPVYYDIWGKVNFQINKANTLSVDFLKAKNDFSLKVNEDFVQDTYFHNIKNNSFGWINWKWMPNKAYYVHTTFGYQDLYANSVNHFIQSITAENTDKRMGQIFSLTQNHLWNINSKHTLEFGFELKSFRTYYRFKETRYDLYSSTSDNILVDSIDVNSHVDGNTIAAFVQDTWSITENISVLPGIRFSGQSYSDKLNVSPRVAVKAEILKNLSLNIAYGIYYQPDDFEKLKSFEGQSKPLSTSSECIHYISSLDYKLGNTNFKIDIYLKDYLHLNDDFRYDVYYRFPFIIDKSFNTQKGKSKGIEFSIRHKYGKNNILSISYIHARNTISNALNEVTWRNFDRRHSILLNSVQNLPRNWCMSFLWMFYSGEPYTPNEISFIGANLNDQKMFFYNTKVKNSARLPNYNTLDFRIAKTWIFKKAQMNIYLNIVNLFNRNNISGYLWYAWQDSKGTWFVTNYRNSLNIPRFISPGISITF